MSSGSPAAPAAGSSNVTRAPVVLAPLVAVLLLAVVVLAAGAGAQPLPPGCDTGGTALQLAGRTATAQQLAAAQQITTTTASYTVSPARSGSRAVSGGSGTERRTGVASSPGRRQLAAHGPRAAVVLTTLALALAPPELRHVEGLDGAGWEGSRRYSLGPAGPAPSALQSPEEASAAERTRMLLEALQRVPAWELLPVADAAAAASDQLPGTATRASRGALAAAVPVAQAFVDQLWPVARAAASSPAVVRPGNTTSAAGPGGDEPDGDGEFPLCPAGPGAGGAATAAIPCVQGPVAHAAADGSGPSGGRGGRVVQGPGGVAIRICTVGPWQVDATIAPQVSGLLAASRAAGFELAGGSFRSYVEQVALRRAHCGSTDYDLYQRPAAQCFPPTAVPGRSMHEWGRALDLTSHGQLIRSHSDPAWQWLHVNAPLYGLQNLPSEPWHWSSNGH